MGIGKHACTFPFDDAPDVGTLWGCKCPHIWQWMMGSWVDVTQGIINGKVRIGGKSAKNLINAIADGQAGPVEFVLRYGGKVHAT